VQAVTDESVKLSGHRNRIFALQVTVAETSLISIIGYSIIGYSIIGYSKL
jgi:hypothetical protein